MFQRPWNVMDVPNKDFLLVARRLKRQTQTKASERQAQLPSAKVVVLNLTCFQASQEMFWGHGN